MNPRHRTDARMLPHLLTARGLGHINVDTLLRVALGHGWAAWIAEHDTGYTVTAETHAERVLTVHVDSAVEAADLALTWSADAATGGPFTRRCHTCRVITRATDHACEPQPKRRPLFQRPR